MIIENSEVNPLDNQFSFKEKLFSPTLFYWDENVSLGWKRVRILTDLFYLFVYTVLAKMELDYLNQRKKFFARCLMFFYQISKG